MDRLGRDLGIDLWLDLARMEGWDRWDCDPLYEILISEEWIVRWWE